MIFIGITHETVSTFETRGTSAHGAGHGGLRTDQRVDDALKLLREEPGVLLQTTDEELAALLLLAPGLFRLVDELSGHGAPSSWTFRRVVV